MGLRTSTLLTAMLSIAPCMAQPADELNFVTGHTDFREIRSMLSHHLEGKALKLLENRQKQIAELRSQQQVEARRRYLREHMLAALGQLPERTPLNPKTVAVIDRGDYRIEKVIFESQPQFFVTANLYVPKQGQPPYPAILYPLGHEEFAKANPVWQQMLGSFAKKGYVALTWDTLGQGERVQMWDEDLKAAKLRQSTMEHTVQGIQCLLVGDTLARYTIWDGIRALDYLLSRKEVDPKRIGITGNSGGGTHTAYIAALDDRIQVAAPSCFITSWGRLLKTIGPQDAEQCLPPWIGDGLDHGDFVIAAAPKPYLILSAIRDFFSIAGARQTYAEADRLYKSLDQPERIRMVEADDGHGYSKPRRMAAYSWFGRWLKGAPDEEPEPEVTIASEQELFCTPTGQVTTSLGGETVFTLNRKRAAQLQRPTGPPSAETVARVIGFERVSGPVSVRLFGTLQRSGYRIDKIVYESEPGIAIPALLWVPESPAGRKPAALFVHGQGKAAGREAIERLVQAGTAVLSIDTRGLGETRPTLGTSDWSRYLGDWDSGMTAMLLGKSLVGMRALDIIRGVDLLAAHGEIDAAQISGIGVEEGGVPLLHAAVLDPRIRGLALDRMLVSYQAVVDHRLHRGIFEQVVKGALKHYDLPDLVAALAPRPVTLVDAADALGSTVSLSEAQSQFERAAGQYKSRQAAFHIVRRAQGERVEAAYRGIAGR